MNMTGTFADARPVAQHCAELTRRGPRPEERAEHLAAWCRDAGHELARELGALFSGGKLHATLAVPETVKGSDVFEKIGPVAVNSLLRCGEGDRTMLLSLDHATAIALTDCSFGGEGMLPEKAPSHLPRSASLLIEQVAGTIAQVLGGLNGSGNARGDVLVRSESVTRLKPFGADADVACFDLTLAVGPFAEWSALLAVASDRLDALMPGPAAQGSGSRKGRASGDGRAFMAMPLAMDAVLGEIDLSVTRLQSLKAGDEFPLAIERELPLRAAEEVLAYGTLGTRDDRMALCLTRFARASAQASEEQSERFEG